jgi:cysteine desulfurase / selenocysteine lyase
MRSHSKQATEREFLKFRALFPAYRQGIYMDHAAVSPLSTLARDTLLAYWKMRAGLQEGVEEELMALRDRFKADIAALIGAPSGKGIALVPNTSTGLNIVASGLPWKRGDRVILNTLEFPANIYPFLNLERLGVKVDWIRPHDGRISVEAVASALRPRTRLLSISFVQFLNGYRADLEAIGKLCRARGVWFVVDGIQGLGAVPMDVKKFRIDALASGGAKWLMWPMGTGFLYCAPELLKALHPAHAGWLGVKDALNFRDYRLDFLETAEKFEGATLNWMGLAVAHRMLREFLTLGREGIWRRVHSLSTRILEGCGELGLEVVTPREPDHRSGIVTLRVPDAEKAHRRLARKGVVISLREGLLRISPHCTNTSEEVEQLLEILARSAY